MLDSDTAEGHMKPVQTQVSNLFTQALHTAFPQIQEEVRDVYS